MILSSDNPLTFLLRKFEKYDFQLVQMFLLLLLDDHEANIL